MSQSQVPVEGSVRSKHVVHRKVLKVTHSRSPRVRIDTETMRTGYSLVTLDLSFIQDL